MTDLAKPPSVSQSSLGTAAARQLATTTKSAPQMQGITSRWLLKLLPWVQVTAGTFRVNRRLSFAVGDGRVTFTNVGSKVQIIPQELGELPLLRGFDDLEVLTALASRFEQRDYASGETIVAAGQPADQIVLIVHGKVNKLGTTKYGEQAVLAVLADGEHFMYQALLESQDTWAFTFKAQTACTVMTLSQTAFEALISQSESLRAHIQAFIKRRTERAQDRYGQAAIEISAGHKGEPELPRTFVDYETSPREYELSVAQTILQVHTRVADLYNEPMNQLEHQLRLTIEELRERQEHELINNREFGLLHNADFQQRLPTRSGPPTPDDFDELLSRRRKSKFFLAHPRAIAAFGRECTRAGIYPDTIEWDGHRLPAWRGVPIFPCSKIPISDTHTTSILVFRTGLEDQGVVGLHQAGIPDEFEPSLSVRFMGINERAIMSYLVTIYFSAAILVPDALGVLEDVEIGR